MVTRSWTGPVPSDEHRCTRNDGRNWRCYAPRHPGSIFCPKHHLNYLSKLRKNPNNPNNRKPKPKSKPATSKPPSSLAPGQIWALTSPSNLRYARIDQTSPCILATPLRPLPVLPEENLLADAKKLGLSSCGTFRCISSSTKSSLFDPASFAFQVENFKVVCWMGVPFYRIFPSKGEVWEVEGRLAEVVSEFSEEEGVSVAELVRVEGTGDEAGVLYRRGLDECRAFLRREMVAGFVRRVDAKRVDGGDGEQQQQQQQQLWKLVDS